MSYASKSGRARISSSNPQAFAVCDRCGIWYNRVDLQWQYQWRGPVLQNIRILVCNLCLDTPQEQLRSIILPQDPTPIVQPRVEIYAADETNYRVTSQPPIIDPTIGIPVPQYSYLVSQDGDNMTTQPIGIPADLDPNAVMPLQEGKNYNVTLPVMSFFSTGTDQQTVTCSAPHGLSTNSQVSVEGSTDNRADGIYSVTVTSATTFTYQTNTIIPAGPLLGATTRIATAIVGLPINYVQIPQTGG